MKIQTRLHNDEPEWLVIELLTDEGEVVDDAVVGKFDPPNVIVRVVANLVKNKTLT